MLVIGRKSGVRVERLRCSPDHLHTLYQQTNREFFGGQLPDPVRVKSHDLSNEKAEGVTYKETEDAFVIVLDPNWNTSEDEALDDNEARVGVMIPPLGA